MMLVYLADYLLKIGSKQQYLNCFHVLTVIHLESSSLLQMVTYQFAREVYWLVVFGCYSSANYPPYT